MILNVMKHIKNYFSISNESGQFEILNGSIKLKDNYLIGQYILISGSVFNDGIFQINDNIYTLSGSRDEIFSGVIFGLAPPRDFLNLVDKIEQFSSGRDGLPSNISSASFGIQSFSYATDSSGLRAGWELVFSKQLNIYRRYTPDIDNDIMTVRC